MSILGVVVRSHPADIGQVVAALCDRPGIDITHNPGDGRLVVVIEDSPQCNAAAAMAALALLPQVQSTSLVYEYSGPDAPAPDSASADYGAWRCSLQQLAEGQPQA
ncbi:MAG: hypothetical protein RJA44_508 [Pseudomonadota bacterium]|jgi:nitrate reductase NapAB chaperone NapD